MGNQQDKIILLDPTKCTANEEKNKQISKEFQIATYYTFKELLEKENMKELSKVIVRERNVEEGSEIARERPLLSRVMSELPSIRDRALTPHFLLNETENDNRQECQAQEEEEQSMLRIDSKNSGTRGIQSYFAEACPLGQEHKKKAIEELVNYKKNYSLSIGIYLLVDDTTNIAIPENEKPYINMVSSDILEIITEIKEEKKVKKFKPDIKFDRLATNMYRRIMVKIIHPCSGVLKNPKAGLTPVEQKIIEDERLLKTQGVSFDYYKSLKDFEMSCISTDSEYVICRPDSLDELLDSRKLSGSDYKIILKPDPDQEDFKVSSFSFRYVWTCEKDIQILIKKMMRCSSIASEEKPEIARNTIICGCSWLFVNNIALIEARARQHLAETHPKGQKFVDELNLKFIGGDKYAEIEAYLCKYAYSLVIVFEQDDFLQSLKARLRASKWAHRVQLTSLQNFPNNSNSLEDYIDWKLKLLQKVRYKIRFEIWPIPSIHYYVHDFSMNNYRHEIELVKTRMGIAVHLFREEDLPRFQPPKFVDFFQSRYVICTIEHLVDIIGPKLLAYEDCYLNKLKIIIIDGKDKIRDFISREENFVKFGRNVCFIHYHISRIIDFLVNARSPIVSLPFFKKKVLRNYEQLAAKLETIKPNIYTLSTELISTNEVLKGIFKEQFEISMGFYIDLLVFTNSERNVKFFEQRYLEAYSRLWGVGYSVWGKFKKKSATFTRMNVKALKEDIKYCFVICKTYDLLKVNDQDFPVFYMDKIDMCTSFHDLQVACLYILSLPHGLLGTIGELLRNPRKSKLTIKIFAAFVFVVLTSFCRFEDKQLRFLKLITYIKDKRDVERLKTLKPGDIVFNGCFQFCCENEEAAIEDNRDCIIYQFQEMHFLDKTIVKSQIHIEDISFYKEGTEFLIAPFAKFQVKQNGINELGMRHLVLTECKEYSDLERSSFTKMVLDSNGVAEDVLATILEEECIFPDKPGEDALKLQEQHYEEKSLYRRNELINFEQSKSKHLNNLQQGLLYNKFFAAFQKKHYVSAMEALFEKVGSLTKQTKNEMFALKNEETLNFLNIEHALLHYKMSEYSSALSYLEKAEEFLRSHGTGTSDSWALKKVHSFIKEVEEVISQRQRFLEQAPKKKKWTVRAHQDYDRNIIFTLRGSKKLWVADFNAEQQEFQLGPKDNEDAPPSVFYFANEPAHEIGAPVLHWHENSLYGTRKMAQNWNEQEYQTGKFDIESKIQRLTQPNKPSSKELEESRRSFLESNKNNPRKVSIFKELEKSEEIVEDPIHDGIGGEDQAVLSDPDENSNIFVGEELAGIVQRKSWQVFYLGPEAKVMSKKKKHFHKKLKKLQ